MLIPFRGSIPSDPSRVMSFDTSLGKLRYNFATMHKVNLRHRQEFQQMVWPVLVETCRVLKPGGYGVFWGLQRTLHWLTWGLEDAGFGILDILTRRTQRHRPKTPVVDDVYSTGLVRETETWILARKPGEPTASANREKWGTGYLQVGDPIQSNLFESFRANLHMTAHPAEKSLGWMKELVTLVTPKGGVVLDPFMGSGTSGVAAVSNGYGFLGVESDPVWFEEAVGRIKPRVGIFVPNPEAEEDIFAMFPGSK